MNSVITIFQFTIFFTLLFIVAYIPIEKLTKNKAWFYAGFSFFGLAALCWLYGTYLSGPVECFLTQNEIKCGVGHQMYAYACTVFYLITGVVLLGVNRYRVGKKSSL